jgi:hypothetical protein
MQPTISTRGGGADGKFDEWAFGVDERLRGRVPCRRDRCPAVEDLARRSRVLAPARQQARRPLIISVDAMPRDRDR